MKMTNLIMILNRATEMRIKSFQIRSEQMEIFKQSNDFSIKSLQEKLKNPDADVIHGDLLWQKGIELKNKAKEMGDISQDLQERASNLEGIYYTLVEEFK